MEEPKHGCLTYIICVGGSGLAMFAALSLGGNTLLGVLFSVFVWIVTFSLLSTIVNKLSDQDSSVKSDFVDSVKGLSKYIYGGMLVMLILSIILGVIKSLFR